MPLKTAVWLSVLCIGMNSMQLHAQQTTGLPVVMDMVHNNPGEAPYVTKYNNAAYIKSQGFTGMVTHWMVNCAVTYDDYHKNLVPARSAERKWIEARARWIDGKLDSCKKAGMEVYPFTDFIVFPESVWKAYDTEISGEGKVEGSGGAAERTRKPDMQKPRTQALLRAQVAALFQRFPQLDGLVLRFGETYLHDAPFHKGGSPIRSGEAGIADHIVMLNILREEICVKRHKKLFYRTWNFGYAFHNNPDYYLAVTNKVEPHPNLFFVIKYQQDDFHRMTPFNPCLGIGKHQQIVEAQCRMEAYGKAAHPYYTASGVIDGWPETKYEIRFGSHDFTGKLNPPAAPRGVKDILPSGLLKGLITWSNGGGWDGPYITHELWTDINVYVLSHWAQQPYKTEEALFYEFAARLGLQGIQADLFRQLNMLTIEGVRKGQLNSYGINKVWWSRDQYFSAAENKPVLRDLLAHNKLPDMLAEKAKASAIWRQIEALSCQIVIPDSATCEAMRVSCTYGRIKFELIEQMWILMAQDAIQETGSNCNKEVVRNAISRYEQLWAEWKALKASSIYCATLYSDRAFRDKEKGSIGELVAKMKGLF